MSKKLTPKDWQLLSAYLDGEIKTSQKERVKARLRCDKQYQVAYQRLQRMRMILRSLPVRDVPRNFTLTSAMVKGEKFLIPPFAHVLRFSSAVSAFALIVLLFFDLIPYLGKGPISAVPQEKAMSVYDEKTGETEVPALPSNQTDLLPEELLEGSGPILGIAPKKERGKIAYYQEPTLPESQQSVLPSRLNFRLLEIITGAVAIMTGALAYFISKKSAL